MVECIHNLDKCKARCCRIIPVPKVTVAYGQGRGAKFAIFLKDLSEDMKKYYRLHGAIVREDSVVFTPKRVSSDGETTLLHVDCKALDLNTLKCRLHDTNDKPECCKRLNEELGDEEISKYYITRNCLLKR